MKQGLCIVGAIHESPGMCEFTRAIHKLPDETLSEGQLDEINRVLEVYPHLNDDEFIGENIEKWKERAGYKCR